MPPIELDFFIGLKVGYFILPSCHLISHVFQFEFSLLMKNVPYFILCLMYVCLLGSILVCSSSHFYLEFFYSVFKAFIANPLILQTSKLEFREIIGFSQDYRSLEVVSNRLELELRFSDFQSSSCDGDGRSPLWYRTEKGDWELAWICKCLMASFS